MSGLVEFVLARIAGDEERARLRICHAREHQRIIAENQQLIIGRLVPGWRDWPVLEADAQRIFAECEAKRRIVERCTWIDHVRTEVRRGVYEQRPVRRPRSDDLDVCEEVLKLLALPCADHPDYREEWRP